MRTKRPIKYLLLSVFSLVGLIGLIAFLPPTFKINIVNVDVSILALFFPLLFIFFFSLITFFFRKKIHGILIGAFVVLYLLFRINGLLHPLFLLLLVGLFLTLELFFRK